MPIVTFTLFVQGNLTAAIHPQCEQGMMGKNRELYTMWLKEKTLHRHELGCNRNPSPAAAGVRFCFVTAGLSDADTQTHLFVL